MSSRAASSGRSDTAIGTIFTDRYRGVELNCIVGDILACNTSAIGIVCDSRFILHGGIAKVIKDRVGNDFMENLRQSREQQDTTAIAVQVPPRNQRAISEHITAPFVILYPVRNVDRNLLNLAYTGIISKAQELGLPSLTIPLLGTGQLGHTIDVAINFLRMALSTITNFGDLEKLQFIDRNENTMRSLREFFIHQLISNQNQPLDSQSASTSRKNRTHQQSQEHQDPNSSNSSSNSAAASSATANSSNSTINLNLNGTGNVDISISLNGANTGEESRDSEMEDSSDTDSSDSSDELLDSDDSDLEDSSDDVDGGISSDDSSEDANHMFDDSDDMDTADVPDTPKEAKKRTEQEKGYWSKVSLRENNEAQQKPTSSLKSAGTKSTGGEYPKPSVKLDDSTMPCPICLTDMREEQENDDAIVQLTLCSHQFHQECIRSAFKVKKQCPLCMCLYGIPIGCQPLDATMNVRQIGGRVPGHPEANGFHEIQYHIPAGTQTADHIRPGEPYRSSVRVAYLPNNAEGTQVLKLLQLAFKRRLIFTIGDSVTTGRKNVPVWNGIHHKTNKEGGAQCYGYPDLNYLGRVKEELAAVGVRSDQL